MIPSLSKKIFRKDKLRPTLPFSFTGIYIQFLSSRCINNTLDARLPKIDFCGLRVVFLGTSSAK
jgi:hypothetical protein